MSWRELWDPESAMTRRAEARLRSQRSLMGASARAGAFGMMYSFVGGGVLDSAVTAEVCIWRADQGLGVIGIGVLSGRFALAEPLGFFLGNSYGHVGTNYRFLGLVLLGS